MATFSWLQAWTLVKYNRPTTIHSSDEVPQLPVNAFDMICLNWKTKIRSLGQHHVRRRTRGETKEETEAQSKKRNRVVKETQNQYISDLTGDVPKQDPHTA